VLKIFVLLLAAPSLSLKAYICASIQTREIHKRGRKELITMMYRLVSCTCLLKRVPRGSFYSPKRAPSCCPFPCKEDLKSRKLLLRRSVPAPDRPVRPWRPLSWDLIACFHFRWRAPDCLVHHQTVRCAS
jgi:hypothetical protein